MNTDEPATSDAVESLAEFKDSFFYGARSDLPTIREYPLPYRSSSAPH